MTRSRPADGGSSFLSGGGTTLIVFGYALVAAVMAGAGSPPAGLGVLVLGLLAALLVDHRAWRDSELGQDGPGERAPEPKLLTSSATIHPLPVLDAPVATTPVEATPSGRKPRAPRRSRAWTEPSGES